MIKLLIPLLITNLMSVNPLEPLYFNENPEKQVQVKDGVLQATVSISKDLPSEFYGTWSVSFLLIDSNNPMLMTHKGSEIWVFSKNKDVITLSNPATQASASITVNQVIGKKAIFTREEISEKYKEIETAEISVEENNFSGTDTIVINHYNKGKYIKTSYIKYQVEGTKIMGPTLKDIFAQ